MFRTPVAGAGLGLLLMVSCAPPPEVRWLEAPSRDPSIDPALHPATQLWGDLVISPGVYETDTGARPWSAFWYPLSGDHLAPVLSKYDRATGRKSLEWHRKATDESGQPLSPWEGRCDAWAFASLLVPATSQKRVAGGVSFEPWEQQALWILSFERVQESSRVVLGHRNSGDGSSPFEDLLPMELHHVLETVLRKGKQPLILDRDPRPPVWNTPVWGGRWEIAKTADPSWWAVSTDLYGVLPLDSPGEALTPRTVVLHYEYRLKVRVREDGSAKVLDSEWVGASRSDHPDFVTIPTLGRSLDHQSGNPEVETLWLEQNLK